MDGAGRFRTVHSLLPNQPLQRDHVAHCYLFLVRARPIFFHQYEQLSASGSVVRTATEQAFGVQAGHEGCQGILYFLPFLGIVAEVGGSFLPHHNFCTPFVKLRQRVIHFLIVFLQLLCVVFPALFVGKVEACPALGIAALAGFLVFRNVERDFLY